MGKKAAPATKVAAKKTAAAKPRSAPKKVCLVASSCFVFSDPAL